MKCVWVAGACVCFTVVFLVALAPALVPASERRARPAAVEAATVPAVTATDIVFNMPPGTRLQDGASLPVSMTFVQSEPKQLGRLFVNENGKLEFQGNAEESAKAFFEQVIKRWEAEPHKAGAAGK